LAESNLCLKHMVNSDSTAAPPRTYGSNIWLYLNPLHLARNLWHRRELIRQFTRREIEGRYKGAFLGLFWSFFNPLMLLLIYTFVFGIVFKARWSQSSQGSLGQFALVLFCGLIPFNIFAECMASAATMIISVPNYVKKVVFPLEILAVARLGAAVFHGLISLVILLGANLLINRSIPLSLLLLPLVALPLVFLSLGLMWFLSSLGVFLRDIGYIVALIVQMVMFGAAIFYPYEALPSFARQILRFNPMLSIVENFRRVVLWGQAPSWVGLLLWLAVTGGCMVLGYAWFMKTKKAFADVL
jgi:lipopolysaccharide transport system permease protein